MDLFFIRHGQSANNNLFIKTGARVGRQADPDLTELGKIQAIRLAEFIFQHPQDFGFTHLYSSLMTRAIQTATPLAEALQLPVLGSTDLHESGGIYLEDEKDGTPIGQVGKSCEELAKLSSRLILPNSLNGSGWWDRPFESPEERPIRARRVAEWLLQIHGSSNDRVAIVSHYGFFNHLIWALLGLERPQGSWFVLNNTAVCRFELTPESINTVYLNRIDHLLPELISE